MPGLFSVPSVNAWGMTPALVPMQDMVLMPLPAVTCLTGSSAQLNAAAVGGYYVDIVKGWRNG